MATGGRKEIDAVFKEYADRMTSAKKLKPDENSRCRRHVGFESGNGTHSGEREFLVLLGQPVLADRSQPQF